jgi:hypothetical protein
MGQTPERDAYRVKTTSALALAGTPNLAVDGTARRRPRAAAQQQAHYSGK